MKLSQIAIKCNICAVHFTPSDTRAIRLMKDQGCISICIDCEKQKVIDEKGYTHIDYDNPNIGDI